MLNRFWIYKNLEPLHREYLSAKEMDLILKALYAYTPSSDKESEIWTTLITKLSTLSEN